MWFAFTIFIIAYIFISAEVHSHTLIALSGGLFMILSGTLTQEDAFHAIDLSVIFLLIGMMLIVELLSETGVFEFIAIKIAKLVKGNPVLLLLMLSFVTALFSAFLDNVTTILLIAPVTIFLTDQLQIDAIPFLISEALASNIGGTATLIGDPPNILIGTAAKLSFSDFLLHLGPVILIILFFFALTIYLLFGRKLKVSRDLKAKILAMRPEKAIKDKKNMAIGLTVLALVILGFLTHHLTHLEPATLAFFGATALLVLTKSKHTQDFFHKVEWNTLFFFIGLFVLVEGLVKSGFITYMAENLLSATQNQLSATSLAILWVSGILSSILDNIPYTATIIPLIKEIIPQIASHSHLLPAAVALPLWWSLSLGACLGGNGTLIGASANVIAASVASKNKRRISFLQFTKFGMLIMLESLFISTIYIYFRYLN